MKPDTARAAPSPGGKAGEGDYILEVDGREVHAPDNFYRLFIGRQNRQTLLRLNSRPTLDGSWTVSVVPVGLDAEFGLRTARWVEDNRRLVDSLSAGRLAYVWLPNTGNEGYSYFNRYCFARQDRPGVIVDERYNGGGKVADIFIDIMKRPLYGFFNNPVGDRRPWSSPEAGIWDAAGAGEAAVKARS